MLPIRSATGNSYSVCGAAGVSLRGLPGPRFAGFRSSNCCFARSAKALNTSSALSCASGSSSTSAPRPFNTAAVFDAICMFSRSVEATSGSSDSGYGTVLSGVICMLITVEGTEKLSGCRVSCSSASLRAFAQPPQRANCSRKNTPSANFILGPLTGGLSRWDKSGLIPPKNMPPPPTFKFCSPGVQHTVYPLWDSYLLVLGGGVLVYQGFLFLKGSRRDFFR